MNDPRRITIERLIACGWGAALYAFTLWIVEPGPIAKALKGLGLACFGVNALAAMLWCGIWRGDGR